jgi:hypothetical protein
MEPPDEEITFRLTLPFALSGPLTSRIRNTFGRVYRKILQTGSARTRSVLPSEKFAQALTNQALASQDFKERSFADRAALVPASEASDFRSFSRVVAL